MCSTFLYEKGQFGVQYLAQEHFGIRDGEDWDRTAGILVRGRPFLHRSNTQDWWGTLIWYPPLNQQNSEL